MVKGEYDTTYLKLREQFDKLSGDTIMHNSKGEELRYILTYELDRFIAINSIIPFKLHINDEDLQTTASGNYKGKMEVNGEFMPVYISRGVLQQICSAEKGDYSDMWKCYISLCESTKGRFWLIHRGKHVDATHNPAPNKTISQIIDIWAKKGLDKAIEVFENSHYQTEGGGTMLFVCYPKCSTCKKAQKWLDGSGIEYDLRDIKEDNPTREELVQWHQKSGLPLKRFFNTSGMLYRDMKLKDKLPQMSEDEMYDLLATDGMLVKRPILVTEDTVLPGFREAEWEKAAK